MSAARKKQPVVHATVDEFGWISVAVGRLQDSIDAAGFKVGDEVSIVMRRKGPKRAKRKGTK